MSFICRRMIPYGVAIASTGIAVLMSVWLLPILDRTIGAFFYIAVIVSASCGGIWPGIAATVLSVLAIDYVFFAPAYQLSIDDFEDILRLGIFLIVASVINVLSSNLRLSRYNVEKLNQRLLKESSDRLQMALNAAHMGLWDWNLATGEMIRSPEYEQLLGLTFNGSDGNRSIGNYIGNYEAFVTCVHPDDREQVKQVLQAAIHNKTPYQHEFRVVWADGSVHWLEGRGQATYDAAGQALQMSGTLMNVDHRKQTELALVQSEQMFRAIFEAEPECVKIITADGILQTMNPAGLAMIEVDSLEQVAGQCVCSLIAASHQQAFSEFLQQVAQGHSGKQEFQITGMRGTQHWLESHAVPLPTMDENPLILAVTRDITERKQAALALQQLMEDLEQRVIDRTAELSEANDRLQRELFQRERVERALQESELKFHAVFDQSRLFIGLLQPDGTVFEVNQRPHELTERVGETFVGRPFWELAIWGAKKHQMKSVIERARSGEVVCLEIDIHALDGSLLEMPDGSIVTHDIRVKAVKNAADQVMFLTAEGWDISDRKQAEAALRQSEARFRSAFEDAAIGMALVSIDGHWLRVNRAICDIVGYSRQELLRTDFQTITHPDDLTADLGYVHQLLSDEIETYQMEKRYFHKQGHIVWVLLSVSLVRNEQNQPLYFISQMQDISKRKQIEEALRQSESNLRSFFNSNSMMMGMVELYDNDIKHLSDNAATAQFFGTTQAAMQNQFASAMGVSRADLAFWLSHYREAQQTQAPVRFEYAHQTAKGQKWLSVTVCAIATPADRAPRCSYIVEDISEAKRDEVIRKQAEAALRQSESTNRALINSIPDLLIRVRGDGTYLDFLANSNINFIDPSRIEDGLSIYDVLPFDQAEERLGYIRQVLQNNQVMSYEYKLLINDQIHHEEARIVPLQTDEVLVVVRDISDRKQSEAVLQESNRRWRSLLDNVQLVVIGLDINGNVEYANPFFLQLTGYSLEDVTGRYWFDSFLSSGQRQPLEICFREALEQNFHTHYQNPILTRSGEERMIAWNNTVLRDASGQPIGTISIGEDITERYRLERMKAEFISVVSHELRTPLTSMQAALSLLVEKIIDPTSEEGETIIQIAAEGVDRLVRLVNDILDLERLDSGKVRLEKRSCNTADLIETAVEQMQELANQAGITLDVAANSFEMVADGDRLLQVLTNLLSNAVKFSASGSTVWLSVELQPNHQQNILLFTVKDQGRGIPTHKLEAIFERFQQVDASDSREKGGTGLGLAICRTIIEQHGGQIWVESILEQGSTFYFTIPIAEDKGNGSQASFDY